MWKDGSVGDGVTYAAHGANDVAASHGLQLGADMVDVRSDGVTGLQGNFLIALHDPRDLFG